MLGKTKQIFITNYALLFGFCYRLLIMGLACVNDIVSLNVIACNQVECFTCNA